MIRSCYSRQKLQMSYMGKARPLIETKQRANLGGAGGIRTHEWRFCRPLPWATWVPRRIFKYSKSPKTLWVTQPAATFSISTFSQRVQEGQFSLHAGSVQLLPAAWD